VYFGLWCCMTRKDCVHHLQLLWTALEICALQFTLPVKNEPIDGL
jgi:hypothetical protein